MLPIYLAATASGAAVSIHPHTFVVKTHQNQSTAVQLGTAAQALLNTYP